MGEEGETLSWEEYGLRVVMDDALRESLALKAQENAYLQKALALRMQENAELRSALAKFSAASRARDAAAEGILAGLAKSESDARVALLKQTVGVVADAARAYSEIHQAAEGGGDVTDVVHRELRALCDRHADLREQTRHEVVRFKVQLATRFRKAARVVVKGENGHIAPVAKRERVTPNAVVVFENPAGRLWGCAKSDATGFYGPRED